jgi:hypothetical protein
MLGERKKQSQSVDNDVDDVDDNDDDGNDED